MMALEYPSSGNTRETIVEAARSLREITPKVLKNPIGYTRAAVAIVLAVKRVYAHALREVQENNKS